MKTESDEELETLSNMWKQLKVKMDADSPQQQPYVQRNLSIQIQALQEELYSKNAKLIDAQTELAGLRDENQQLIADLEQAQVENGLLDKRLEELNERLNQQLDGESLQQENEALRFDIQRLLELLRKTKEFGDLNLTNMTYVKGKPIVSNKTISVDEAINWIPIRAKQILEGIDAQKANDILLSLSYAFNEHYSNQNTRLKETAKTEIATLKRQLQSRTPFEAVISQKTMKMKKAALDTAQVQDLFTTLKSREAQIQILQDQVKQLENQLNEKSGSVKKKAFIEGALWMLQKLLDEIIQYENDLIQMNYSLSNKIDDLLIQQDIIQQSIINKVYEYHIQVYKYITDNQEELVNNLKSKLRTIMEQTEAKLK